MRRAYLCVAFFGVALALILGVANARTPTAKDPQMKLQGLDGHFYDLAEMRGSVVLVSFGATWCSPCSGELIALEAVTHEYAQKPVKFFWVSVESPAQISDSDLKRYVKAHKLTFPVLRDPTKTTFLQFSERLRLPMTVVFDKNGQPDGPAQFGMSSQPEIYKNHVRERLNKLLASPRSEGESDN